MKNFLKRAGQIKEGFTSSEVDGEQWVIDRRKICESCDHNSKNVKEDEKTPLQNLREMAGKALNHNTPYCKACYCYIHEKTRVRSAVCGLEDKGLPPKWTAVEVSSSKYEKVLFRNKRPHACTLVDDFDKTTFVFENVVKGSKIKGMLELVMPDFWTVSSTKPTCYCTTVSFQKTSPTNYSIPFEVDTTGFSGIVSKTFIIVLHDGNKSMNLMIYIKIKMK